MEAGCFRYYAVKDLVKYRSDPFDSEINFLAQGDGSWENILYKSIQRKTVTIAGSTPSHGHPERKRRQPLESKDLFTSEHKHRFMKAPKEDSHPERRRRRSWSRMGITLVRFNTYDYLLPLQPPKK